jgi:hypothetical protein
MSRALGYRHLIGLLAATLLLQHAAVAQAQSLDDLELRKRKRQARVSFGMLGLLETSTSLNRDRPTLTNLLFVAPQLKIGDRLRLRANLGVFRHWLDRQPNPWDLTDWSLQLSHLGLYREKHSGLLLSGYLRYAFPTSKASRNAGSYGQLRGMLKVSRSFLRRFFVALELTGRKNFHGTTSWDTSDQQPGASWSSAGSFDAFVQNNVSFGFGQTLTGSASLLPGIDFNAIFGLLQGRQYAAEPRDGLPARQTRWQHAMRFVLDLTLSLGPLSKIDIKRGGFGRGLLARSFVSFGYALFAPQLRGEMGRSLNPFDPRFASLYLDLIVVY